MTRSLADFQVLTLDCYGTLIDWETGIWDALQPLIARNGRGDVTRGPALAAFADLEAAQEAATPELPYPDVLRRVHRDLASGFGMDTDEDMDAAFGASVPLWPAFPDTADALRSLHRSHRLAVLSNVDRAGLEASRRRLGVAFDLVCTADVIGSYKPRVANFEHLITRLEDELGIGRDGVLHTAQSVYHDIVPAASVGLATAWIDRQGLAHGGAWGATVPVADRPEPNFTFATLAEMASAVATG